MAEEPVIEIRNLFKHYQKFEAVSGITFTVYRGDVFGFLGPNGAGKSTTIRMLTSLIKPSSGEIRIFGRPLATERNYILSKVGAIVEKPDLYLFLSAFNNLKLLSKMSGKSATESKIMEVLDMVGLKERAHSKVKTFSQGMKQRMGIAQALIHDPELIILDEPTNGLDPQGMVEIRGLIRKLSREHKKTILISSHILNEIELLANRMVIINKGKVVVEGEVEKLLNTDVLKVTYSTNQPEKAAEVIENSVYKNGLRDIKGQNLIMEIKQTDVPDLTKLLVNNNIKIISVVPKRSLEDYFLNLT